MPQEGLTTGCLSTSEGPGPSRPAAKVGNRKSASGNREQATAKAKAKARAGAGAGAGDVPGVPEAIAKLPVAAAAARLRAKTMRDYSNMQVVLQKALAACSASLGGFPKTDPADGDDNDEVEDENVRSLRYRFDLLTRFSSKVQVRTKDAASVKLQGELYDGLGHDAFLKEVMLSENWTAASCWTLGMIEHFRSVEMELLGSSSQVYTRQVVCDEAMGIITRVSKALLQDVQQMEADRAADEKAAKAAQAAQAAKNKAEGEGENGEDPEKDSKKRRRQRVPAEAAVGEGIFAMTVPSESQATADNVLTVLRLRKGQEKKVMDAAPMAIPSETKAGYVKTINTSIVEFAQKFESIAATRPRITSLMECPAGVLGMDALLMAEVDACVQHAAKPSVSLVLDRGAVTSMVDGDGELDDAQRTKEHTKLKGAVLQAFAAGATYAGNIPGNLGAFHYQRQGSKHVIAISYQDALAHASIVRESDAAKASGSDQATATGTSPMMEALNALENMNGESECPQGLRRAYVCAGDVVYYPPCTLILEFAAPAGDHNVGFRVSSMYAPNVPELLDTLNEMNSVSSVPPTSSALCTIQALERWKASGAERALQLKGGTPTPLPDNSSTGFASSAVDTIFQQKPHELRDILSELPEAELHAVVQKVKMHSAFNAYVDYVCGEMGVDPGPGEDQYEFGGAETDVPEA
ncbi:unnamed protein product [Symbiodinium sp. CCMP2456]|nr:unnamed protein product [Symbiodinium sp. CCMP2456]